MTTLKHALSVLISSVIFSYSYPTSEPLLHLKVPEFNAEQVLNKNLEKIISQQEKAMGLKFPDHRLKMEFCAPYHFIFIRSPAIYDPENNNIKIINNLLLQGGISSWVMSAFTYGLTPEGLQILYHELGHFYLDKLSEDLGLGNWPKKEDYKKNVIGIKLVSEGLATYFERKMTLEEDKFKDGEWPAELNKFWDSPNHLDQDIIYYGGYHLIKPIVDKYGEWGIIYLMFRPPQADELLELPKYQNTILQELSLQKPIEVTIIPSSVTSSSVSR